MACLAIAGCPASQSLGAAGPSTSLCAMDSSRGSVPENFAVDACVDGSMVVLHNQLEVPLQVTVMGGAGPIVTTPGDIGFAATSTRRDLKDPTLLLPGDVMHIPIGSSAATVHLAGPSRDKALLYGWYRSMAPVLSEIPGANVYEAAADLAKAWLGARLTYEDCLVGQPWLGQSGCWVRYVAAVTAALGVVGATFGLKAVSELAALMFETGKSVLWTITSLVETVELKYLDVNRTITQSARSPVPPAPITHTTDPVPGPAGPTPTQSTPSGYPSGDFYFAALLECGVENDSGNNAYNAVSVSFNVAYAGGPLPNNLTMEMRSRYNGTWTGPFFNSPQAFMNQEQFIVVSRLPDMPTEATGTVLIRIDYGNNFAEPNETDNDLTVTFTRPAGHHTGFYMPIPCHIG